MATISYTHVYSVYCIVYAYTCTLTAYRRTAGLRRRPFYWPLLDFYVLL